VTPRATARAFREETAFATVLSGCDAEFALRVDPSCPSLNCTGHATARKRRHAQPYILTIVRGARSIAAGSSNCALILVQRCKRSPYKLLYMLLAFGIAERRCACRAIALASFLLAPQFGKKVAAGQLKQRI
jgi:hypothetical protein